MGSSPEYLKDLIIFRTPQIPTRYALNSPLYIPKPKTEYMKKSFQYHGSCLWNPGGGVLTYYGKRGSAALMGDFSAKSP